MMEKEYMCGGTSQSVDDKAAKEIKSNEAVIFNVSSALGFDVDGKQKEIIDFISAIAVKVEGGAFLLLETRKGRDRYAQIDMQSAYIKADPFKELNELVKKYDFIKSNGRFSFTHGLPENFGGEVYIKYASEETIKFADNQEPIFGLSCAVDIANIFRKYIKSRKNHIPTFDDVKEIRFCEEDDNDFQKACVDFSKGFLVKRSAKYGEDVFESEKTLNEAQINKIRAAIDNGRLCIWDRFPEDPVKKRVSFCKKSIEFILKNGASISFSDDRYIPSQLSGAFFDLSLVLTVN